MSTVKWNIALTAAVLAVALYLFLSVLLSERISSAPIPTVECDEKSRQIALEWLQVCYKAEGNELCSKTRAYHLFCSQIRRTNPQLTLIKERL